MWDEATEKFNRNAEQDRKDMERVREQVKKTREAAQAAAQNVHSPYIPKIAKDVNDMKNGKGKGTNAILDILKEIAGVTVINKVTKVRPDVVFNFGSYGRSGKNEDPNLVSVGDTEQLAAAIMSLMDTSDTSIEVMKNGATVALA
jgi:predicted ATP-grasp superfamily ATP-dependent carboligase